MYHIPFLLLLSVRKHFFNFKSICMSKCSLPLRVSAHTVQVAVGRCWPVSVACDQRVVLLTDFLHGDGRAPLWSSVRGHLLLPAATKRIH